MPHDMKTTALERPRPIAPSLQQTNDELLAMATSASSAGKYARLSDERVNQMASAIHAHSAGPLEALYLAREVIALRQLCELSAS